MSANKLYIFTIPKSGTYFLAGLMSRLGWDDSGMHVAENLYLYTKNQSLATAASDPFATEREMPFYQSLSMVGPGQLCCGHMNPMLFFAPHRSDFAVIGCRRRLRDVLVAEFVDFRFRRLGDARLSWVQPTCMADDKQAFVEYLKRNGPAIADITATYLGYRDLRAAQYYNHMCRPGPYVDLSFEHLMGPYPLGEMRRMARAMGLDRTDQALLAILQDAKAADNKTKTRGEAIAVDRASLWDHPDARAEYERQGLQQLSILLGYPS